MNLSSNPIFRGISEEELGEIFSLSYTRQNSYEKNQIIFHSGDTIHEIGIILNGSVHIEMIDFWGNKSILSSFGAGQVFAETYALCKEPMLVDAVAAEKSQILFLDLALLSDHSPAASTVWQQKLIHNLLSISVQKNLVLTSRIFCTTPKTIRERLLTYLSSQSLKAGSSSFDIPFNRQQLADYLNLDRSALSKELGTMRDDGILEFHKNHFTLKSHEQINSIN